VGPSLRTGAIESGAVITDRVYREWGRHYGPGLSRVGPSLRTGSIESGTVINFSFCHVETVKTLTALQSLADCTCSPERAGSNTSVIISKCAHIEGKFILIY